MHSTKLVRGLLIAAASAIAISANVLGDPVTVRQTEGLVHGFLAMRTLDGAVIADGDLSQKAVGDRVTSRLSFQFRDGSTQEETTIYLQRGRFRLISDHLIQKGPRFPTPIDMTIDGGGAVTVRYTDDGAAKEATERMELPADVANGMILVLLKNVRPGGTPTEWSYVAATPEPQLVKLKVSAEGEDAFHTGGTRRQAVRYVVKVDIGGIKGVIAPLLGKQPPDSRVWILGGDHPAFIRSEQPLYLGGPITRIELVSPQF